MATLVLTAVGTIVGGPIGGAIGAFVGQQIDRAVLFKPKGRQGPRLGDLTVQTSAYGNRIPRIFGRMRIAGTVIWATDLRETRTRSGGGKGRPKTTTYSYSASFAVALSGRPIQHIGRIWADGKLLRGAAGDWKTPVTFRLHTGSEEQAADPLLASAEGPTGTPAYRGIGYAVFQDLPLEDFGNRIPSLTFEVTADAGPVAVSTIARELTRGGVGGDTTAALAGYAASGDSVRGAIETIAEAISLSVSDDGQVLILRDAAPAPIAIAEDELGARSEGEDTPRLMTDRQAAGTLPDEVAIRHYEPARDYQTGLQRARRGGQGRRVDEIDLPAVLDAGQAKSGAELRLAEIWSRRIRFGLHLPWRRLDLRPGDAIAAGGLSARIARWTLENMVLRIDATSATAVLPAASASAGRPTQEADMPHGATRLALIDTPPLGDDAETVPRLAIATAGVLPGWRKAALIHSIDGGASWSVIGPTAAPAIIGSTATVLPAGDPALFDLANGVDIDLIHDGMLLEGRDDDALIAGANAAILGNELIQFGGVTLLGPTRVRLTRLLRGRRGTEWAMADHAIGERFILLDAETLVFADLPPAAIGSDVRVLATGAGDADPVEAALPFTAHGLRPPSPVHVTATRLPDGAIGFAWVRRSRAGWAWSDHVDAPLAEEIEAYRLTISPGDGAQRIAQTSVPAFVYDTGMQAEDGASIATSFDVSIVQTGSFAASRPAQGSFIL